MLPGELPGRPADSGCRNGTGTNDTGGGRRHRWPSGSTTGRPASVRLRHDVRARLPPPRPPTPPLRRQPDHAPRPGARRHGADPAPARQLPPRRRAAARRGAVRPRTSTTSSCRSCIAAVGPLEGRRVLDLGCGAGCGLGGDRPPGRPGDRGRVVDRPPDPGPPGGRRRRGQGRVPPQRPGRPGVPAGRLASSWSWPSTRWPACRTWAGCSVSCTASCGPRARSCCRCRTRWR